MTLVKTQQSSAYLLPSVGANLFSCFFFLLSPLTTLISFPFLLPPVLPSFGPVLGVELGVAVLGDGGVDFRDLHPVEPLGPHLNAGD